MEESKLRYHCIRDSDVHVGHENSTKLAVDNSLHIASLYSYMTVNRPASSA